MDIQTLITTAGICAVVFMLLVSVLPGMLRGVIANKAQNQFMAGDFDAVLKTLSGPMASLVVGLRRSAVAMSNARLGAAVLVSSMPGSSCTQFQPMPISLQTDRRYSAGLT